MEQLRQTVEDKDNDPMDTIKHLEQKLKPVSYHTLPTHGTHWGSSKQIYQHFMYHSEENISRKLIITRYHHIEWE